MKDRIIQWLKKYKELTNCKGVVLGVSGGKDSTVVAMLSKLVFGDNIVGVIMPNGAQIDIDDAIKVCQVLNIEYKIVNIKETYDALLKDMPIKISDKSKTNIPPRLRMTTLYAIAQTLGYRVIGTGNASERTVGWTTKWGDGAHDFNPIADLTVGEIYEHLRALNAPSTIIDKAPSAGLYQGQTDEQEMGIKYSDVDKYLRGEQIPDDVKSKIERAKARAGHKLRMPLKFGE